MKSLALYKFLIEQDAPFCPECGESYFDWIEAEPDDKICYIGPDALFVGICSRGHFVEFHLAELKTETVIAHMRTERTLGRRVKQIECSHARKILTDLPEGRTPGYDGMLVGPCKIFWCFYCGARWKAPNEPPKSDRPRLILPPGA